MNKTCKFYPSGYAIKITIERDEEKTYAVIFDKNVVNFNIIVWNGRLLDEHQHLKPPFHSFVPMGIIILKNRLDSQFKIEPIIICTSKFC